MSNKTKLIALLLIAFSALSYAQKAPSFSQYTTKIEKKTAKNVNLESHSEAKLYRTNLKNALTNSDVNFAGKFILTAWGCGIGCTQGAIIDAKTGNVFFPIELQGVYAGSISLGDHNMLDFKKESNLLLIYGYAGGGFNPEKETQHGVYYYLWTGKAFKLIKFIKKKA